MIHCLSEIQISLGVLYFYSQDLLTPRKESPSRAWILGRALCGVFVRGQSTDGVGSQAPLSATSFSRLSLRHAWLGTGTEPIVPWGLMAEAAVSSCVT